MSYAGIRSRQLKDAKGAMVDRTAYVTFLENEIERVASAARQVHNAVPLMDELRMQINTCEAKIANNTRLAKITQTFAEQLEDDTKKFKVLHTTKTHQLDDAVATLAKQMELLGERADAGEHRASVMHDRMSGLETRVTNDVTRRQGEMEQRLANLEARMTQNIEMTKLELTRQYQERMEDMQNQLDSIVATVAEESRRREDIVTALREDVDRRIVLLSDEISDVRRSVKHIREDVARSTDTAMGKYDAQIGSVTSKIELLESRMSHSVAMAVDSVRDSETRAVKDMHARMDEMHSTVNNMSRHVTSLETDILRQREIHHAKMQTLETRCEALQAESTNVLERVHVEVDAIADTRAAGERRKIEEINRVRDIEMRLATLSEECMSQVNMLAKMYSQHQADIQDAQLRTRRLEATLGGGGGVVVASAAPTARASSPVREPSPRRWTRASTPDASRRPSRPLESTIHDLQALVHSMESGADKTPHRGGGGGEDAISPARHGPVNRRVPFAAAPRSSRRELSGGESSDGAADVSSGAGETKEERRARIRQLYTELTALEVEEAKERKKTGKR